MLYPALRASEETGLISLAVDGKLIRGLSDSELREKLGSYLLNPKPEKKNRLSRKNKQTDAAETAVVAEEEVKTAAEEPADMQPAVEEVASEAVGDAIEENNSEVTIEAPFEEILTEEENGIVNEGVENDEQE